MQQTTNLKLNKPDTGDPVKISDLNANADILDTAVADKLDKAGGTMTGKLSVGDASMDTNGYVTATWLQTTSATNLSSATQVAVLSGGWIYYMTLDQLKSKIGGSDITVVDTWI